MFVIFKTSKVNFASTGHTLLKKITQLVCRVLFYLMKKKEETDE
jgi:hypothetical protein